MTELGAFKFNTGDRGENKDFLRLAVSAASAGPDPLVRCRT
jgi:hypothetical protein